MSAAEIAPGSGGQTFRQGRGGGDGGRGHGRGGGGSFCVVNYRCPCRCYNSGRGQGLATLGCKERVGAWFRRHTVSAQARWRLADATYSTYILLAVSVGTQSGA